MAANSEAEQGITDSEDEVLAEGEEEVEDEDEEEDDNEDKKEEEVDPRPMGPTPTYQVNPDADSRPADAGSLLQANGADLYQVGPLGTGSALLLVGDFWGWNAGRTRNIADFIAASLNTLVIVPKLLGTPALEGGTEGDGLPEDFDLQVRKTDLKPYLMKYVWESIEPKIQAAVMQLRKNGMKRLAGLGIGFGAWILCHTSRVMSGEYAGSVMMHPSIHVMEDLFGGSSSRLAERITGPVFFATAGNSSAQYAQGGDVFEAVRRKHPFATELASFPSMQEGWVAQGDISIPPVKFAVEEAVSVATHFIRKILWPPPPGADAGMLRHLAKEGDADAMVDLLVSGVAAGGKDAADSLGMVPIHYAAREGHPFPVKLLVDWKANPDEAGGAAGDTALHVAAAAAKGKVVSILLQCGATPEVKDKAGQTPLHHAARVGATKVVVMLLEGRASLNAVDTAEQTALHLAAWHGKAPAVMALLRARMDVDPEDLRVVTPQKRAAQMGFKRVAGLLEAERTRREEEEFHAQNPVDGTAKEGQEKKGKKKGKKKP